MPGYVFTLAKLVFRAYQQHQNDEWTCRSLNLIDHLCLEGIGGAGSHLDQFEQYQHHDSNWFAGGGNASDVVRKRGDVRRRVNAWLGDANRLQTNYELVVRDLLPSDLVASELSQRLDGELHDLLASIIARVADREQPDIRQIADELSARFDKARDVPGGGPEMDLHDMGPFPEIQDLLSAVTDTEWLSQSLADSMVDAQPEDIQDLVLVDQRTDTPVSHRDVGIGVSQVLPVLVSAYASTDKLLAIEQPEIHLHPALQAELGDVFIESALGEGRNTFLIETHSEHLLLRIMRRMRETSAGKLPDGVPELQPEDVMVRNPDSITRWTRLGGHDRDGVQRELDPASGQHALHAQFTIP